MTNNYHDLELRKARMKEEKAKRKTQKLWQGIPPEQKKLVVKKYLESKRNPE